MESTKSNIEVAPHEGLNPDTAVCDDNSADDKAPDNNSSGNEASSDKGRDDEAHPDVPIPRQITIAQAPHPDVIPRQITIAQARHTDYEGFKNYFSEEESRYAIDVLLAGCNLKHELGREKSRRRAYKHGWPQPSPVKPSTEKTWIQRVRINSRHILSCLSLVTGREIDKDKSLTFFRPFHTFSQSQQIVKELLRKLKSILESEKVNPGIEGIDILTLQDLFVTLKRSDDNDDESDDGENGSDDEDESDDSYTKIQGEVKIALEGFISQDAVEHLECYVDFVDKHILPLEDSYKGTLKSHIRFADLAYLFRPGDLIYRNAQANNSLKDDKAATSSLAVSQPIKRVLSINAPFLHSTHPEIWRLDNCFYIHNACIDFDGKDYGLVKSSIRIKPYQGEKQIKSLPVYPIRYHKAGNKGSVKTNPEGPDVNQHEPDHNIQKCIKERHLYYNGWKIIKDADGDTLEDSGGEKMNHTEHIDSNVIVDFDAALQAIPQWKPGFWEPELDTNFDWTVCEDDDLPLLLWSDNNRTHKKWVRNDLYIQRDIFFDGQAEAVLKEDPFVVALKADRVGVDYRFSDDDALLLPQRVMAYVLRTRKFAQIDIRHLSEIKQETRVFDDLEIDPGHKEMVISLVNSHFRKRALQGSYQAGLGQDLIHGKGNGLVILLHGAPGVGKTATAEAVAQINKQPLFTITCGDLGLTPREVEETLEEIFRLAHLWNCVLLLDEADVFLSRRTHSDLKRNALVSTFLRILEYYNGILFLTTNRVGSLDEAFKSRIHMSLYYPPLNGPKTKKIFEMNIQRIKNITGAMRDERTLVEQKEANDKHGKTSDADPASTTDDNEQQNDLELDVDGKDIMAFAKWHFDHHPYSRWNGRQIRNAFQIASSLAFYERRTSGEQTTGRACLNANHFAKVAKATKEFDKYMLRARGLSDGDIAKRALIRDDEFTPSSAYMNYQEADEWPGSEDTWDADEHDQAVTQSHPYQTPPSSRLPQNAGVGSTRRPRSGQTTAGLYRGGRQSTAGLHRGSGRGGSSSWPFPSREDNDQDFDFDSFPDQWPDDGAGAYEPEHLEHEPSQYGGNMQRLRPTTSTRGRPARGAAGPTRPYGR